MSLAPGNSQLWTQHRRAQGFLWHGNIASQRAVVAEMVRINMMITMSHPIEGVDDLTSPCRGAHHRVTPGVRLADHSRNLDDDNCSP
jgi:hypothetical protein